MGKITAPRPSCLFVTIVPLVLLSSWLNLPACQAQTFHYSRGWTNGKRSSSIPGLHSTSSVMGSSGSRGSMQDAGGVWNLAKNNGEEVSSYDNKGHQELSTPVHIRPAESDGADFLEAYAGISSVDESPRERGHEFKQYQGFCQAELVHCRAELRSLEKLVVITSTSHNKFARAPSTLLDPYSDKTNRAFTDAAEEPYSDGQQRRDAIEQGNDERSIKASN